MKQQAQIGLIGLGVMGANLARNLANHKISTIVFNRTPAKTETFIAEYGNSHLEGSVHLEGLVESLEKPRKVILMVPAGPAVDEIIGQLTPLLSKGDIIIDGGNSFYKDTERRFEALQKKGIELVGCGISGGEEGALKGPSLMPGGSKKAWNVIKPILEKIAANDFKGKPCVTYIGEGASGHYVKMVHNGIEYAVLQLMAEAYFLLSRIADDPLPPAIAKIFQQLNKGKLNSYLFEIASKVLTKKDPFQPKEYLIDFIADVAEQKGTGKWTTLDALDQNVAIPTLTEAVFARFISTQKERRSRLDKKYFSQHVIEIPETSYLTKVLENGLYAAILSSYAQGYHLIQQASENNHWDIDLAEISRIWQGGCIIRSHILASLCQGFRKNKRAHLFELPFFIQEIKKSLPDLRELALMGIKNNIPLPAFLSSLSYFESMLTSPGSAHFIQGLRDYFGAHTYQRIDKKGIFHTDW